MIDFMAYLACGFVLFSATTNTVKWFRLASLGSNICFVAYGLWLDLTPLLLLHGLLAPMNAMQFLRAWHEDKERRVFRNTGRLHAASTTS